VENSFRNVVPADLPDGTKQRLCVVPRDEWLSDDSPFWSFARTAASEGWLWVVSANFASVDAQIVLMYLPPADQRPRYRMVWDTRAGRGAFRLEPVAEE
jgi:hypothetical protein